MPNQTQGFRLSPQQKRLWLLQQDSSAYYAQCAIFVEGNAHIKNLKGALQKVVNRNEILRTNFLRVRGIKLPIQVIKKNCIISLNEHNNEEDHDLVVDLAFQQERQRYVNWEKDLLLHTSLVSLSPDKHILIVSLPSLCADRRTLNNLVSEIGLCYTAYLQGEEPYDEPLQYADLAEWQNELIEARETELGIKYWRQSNVSALKTTKLVNEHRHYGEPEFAPQFMSLPIPLDLVTKIEVVAQYYQASTSVFFLACWQILLWRLTGKSDLVIGISFNGRNYEELKEALGLFAKYLPLAYHLDENHRFSKLVCNVQKLTRELSEWQESFAWEPSDASDEDGVNLSFFPFCFEFEEASPHYSAANISFSIYKYYVCFDRFKVKLSCIHTKGDAFNAEFHYDANLFAKEDIQRLASQFETLLASVINNPEGKIAQLSILSQKERSQLLVEFNSTKTEPLQHQCIHHWFEQQCDRTPDNIAVIFENQKLTYQELNAHVNQLAHYLQKFGVGSEVLVGIYIERSLLMVIGLLGILKAGGAYVPIDPTYPTQRKAFILQDTQMSLLLTQQCLAPNTPTDRTKVICLDTDWQLIAQESRENPTSQTTALNLAYVIYTSGSTGKPKGTLIPHKGLVNYLNWCTKAYAIKQGSGTLVDSSLSFDLTITSLFSPLLVGLSVALLPERQGIDSVWHALRQSSNLSLLKITPAHLKLLSQQLSPQEAAGRTRALIIGGENLTAHNVSFWQDFAPDTILVNEYGPTETVVGCCIYQVPTGQHYSGSIPIGQPIANTQLYVLDRQGQPVPIGVAGELHIGGLGLARGYLNRPELTAEKFIPHPYSNEPGERLYKTGDLATFRSYGTLEYLGRLDEQVKIRGFLIELGEISAVLSQEPSVQDALVVVREDVPGDQRLVAYVVPSRESIPTIPQLRDFLKETLPEYMMPSAFVLLEELPLTPNGKVDRRGLPAPDQVRPEFTGVFVAPRTPVEEKLAKIWAELLRVKRVGIHDNFFDLGGHSLLVTQVLSRLRNTFEVEVPLSDFFETPTVADLAVTITQRLAGEIDSEILAKTFAELEQLSEEEVQAVLTADNQSIDREESRR